MAYASPVNVPIKSLFGRYLGLDRSNRLYALNGLRDNVTSITTASTNVVNHGISSVSSSSGQWTVDAPAPGVIKRIFATSTSTLARAFTLASGNFETGIYNSTGNPITAGSSFTTLTLNGQGQAIDLVGISTAKFAVMGLAGFSTAATPFTTA